MIRKLLQKLGIDKAIFYTSFARVIQGMGGVVSVMFVARFLTGIEQGFYYTFASLLAIQIFFELGLGGIITQYVAHENAHLNWDEQRVSGDNKYISRLASLLRFCIKWYSILAIVLLMVLIAVGIIYFNIFYTSEEPVAWMIPWIILCVGTTFNFIIAPIMAFLEGLGKVKQIAQYRFWAQFIMMGITWSGLYLGAKLYVGGIASVTGAMMFGLYILFSCHRKTLTTLFKVNIVERLCYRSEIFPYQWKIALSWVSGYFIFQLFNPVLFAYSGAVVAGQMGMTLTILNGISSLAMSWITTKVPLLSGLIAKKDYVMLDRIFNKSLIQLLFICLNCLLIFIVGVFLLEYFQRPERLRLLDWLPLILMCVASFVNQMVFAWATYLRCHKQEPFMVQSIVLGILTCVSTLVLGKIYGVNGVVIGYTALITCLSLPWSYEIFLNKKRAWH